MALRQLALTLPAAQVVEAERLLTLAGAISTSCADAGDSPLLEPAPGSELLWPTVRLRALLPITVDPAGIEQLLARFGGTEVTWDEFRDEDWRGALEQTVRPRAIGTRLLLAPADWAGTSGDRTIVRLHMGLAFGTGEHPTTALCLEWLERRGLAGQHVLDFGCGSGVLAIAAVLLGARRAWATDTEPQALTATRRNAVLNGVEPSVWIGAPADLPAIRADIVLANIVAGTLIESADWLADHVTAAGRIVLSGLLETQRVAVEQAFATRFEAFESQARAGWLCLSATARATD